MSSSSTSLEAELRREKPAVRGYLFAYNAAQSAGWAALLMRVAVGGEQFAAVQPLVWLLLVSITIEIVHDFLGFVRVSDMNYLLRLHCKIFRRLHLFASLSFWATSSVQSHLIVPVLLVQWALLDLIRYPFYALNSLRVCPPSLRWLRYSAFIVMYPIGITLELALWCLMLHANAPSGHDVLDLLPRNFSEAYFWFALGHVFWRMFTFPINYTRMLGMRSVALDKVVK
jgi:very-long-chain (3R)-3-hydroxyacyl-CoA dehydratase